MIETKTTIITNANTNSLHFFAGAVVVVIVVNACFSITVFHSECSGTLWMNKYCSMLIQSHLTLDAKSGKIYIEFITHKNEKSTHKTIEWNRIETNSY